MDNNQLWVVKIGGSLLGSAELPHWLELLAKHSKGRLVVVPGGGVFADAVRTAQGLTGIDDALAHELALLAMDQFGLLLAGMRPGFVTAASELELAERGWQHQAMVWLPSKMVLADASVEQNWQVSSDSLSAWLANKLEADQLLLVKSKPLETYQQAQGSPGPRLLADGVIDGRLLDCIAGQSYQTSVISKGDYALFAQGFSAQLLQEKALIRLA